MQKSFSLSNDKAMVNFTANYCDTAEKLLSSCGFRKVLLSFLSRIEVRNSCVHRYLKDGFESSSHEKIADGIIDVFKLLTIFKAEEVLKLNNQYKEVISEKEKFVDFIEELYGYWRKLERYSIIQNEKIHSGFQNVSFIEANSNFSKLVLECYRTIEQNILGYPPKVYRQLPAGGNAGLIVCKSKWKYPEGYEKLDKIPFIDSILLDPPFITYPKKNTRDGYFTECSSNPLEECSIDPNHWFCYPAKVGSLLAYVYFHRDFMAHGVTLCNLFELARAEEYEGKKPDMVYVFGARDSFENVRTVFYDDVENDIMLGYVNYNEAIDYFGYMKKMILTLHNLIMIKEGCLPVHGAMVNIIMKNGKSSNVVIMGDSGAGKSESLEAFRALSEKYVSDMTIVFDDMGVVRFNGDEKPLAYGTEIGAFVRLDDLDQGYAFKEIDRSIFMNPDKTNARLVMPVATYKEITHGYPVDFFLYANNYEEVKEGMEALEYFENADAAIKVFRDGARMAKGTTTEKGLVKSYFANPFGPHQKQEETDKLLDKYFGAFFKTGVKVGQIRTCLGIKGMEKEGPQSAALKLFDTIFSS